MISPSQELKEEDNPLIIDALSAVSVKFTPAFSMSSDKTIICRNVVFQEFVTTDGLNCVLRRDKEEGKEKGSE